MRSAPGLHAGVYVVAVHDDATGAEPGHFVSVDEADPDMPYALVVPLTEADARRLIREATEGPPPAPRHLSLVP